ncbi:hypothetical protein JKP88DRAFT_309219 [Tribonema minus]|uniref:GCK domain-containing protein n=1 Tax=Tribonema minus TaxID=303371 RepID=A0A836CKE6_9STRA|nr:hypothetical protein JKP88DRAFT_309219 [Tribonema minus]
MLRQACTGWRGAFSGAAAAAGVWALAPWAACSAEAEPPDAETAAGISVYLDDASVEQLALHFAVLDTERQQRLRRVVVQPRASAAQRDAYAPLMGAPATVEVTVAHHADNDAEDGKRARVVGRCKGGGYWHPFTATASVSTTHRHTRAAAAASVHARPAGAARSKGVTAFTARVAVRSGPVPSLMLPAPFISDTAGDDDISITAVSASTGSGDAAAAAADAAAEALVASLGAAAVIAEGQQRPRAFKGVIAIAGAPAAHKFAYAAVLPLHEPLTLRGTLCADDAWDFEKRTCAVAAAGGGNGGGGGGECPLCAVMRESPCAAPFQAWLDCAEVFARDAGLDEAAAAAASAAKCEHVVGPLRACIDAHRELFAQLFGDDNEGGSSGDDDAGGGDSGGDGSGDGSGGG